MKICSPHVGISLESNLGGEVYEREILKHMALLGVDIEIILPKGKLYENGLPNWNVTRLPISRGYTWYGAPFLFLPTISSGWRLRCVRFVVNSLFKQVEALLADNKGIKKIPKGRINFVR